MMKWLKSWKYYGSRTKFWVFGIYISADCVALDLGKFGFNLYRDDF